MQTRSRSLYCAAGGQGIGKTWQTKIRVQQYLRKYQQPVIALDLEDEYPYIPIDYDVNNKNTQERIAEIKKVKRPEAYRILPYCKDGSPMDIEQLTRACLDVMNTFKKGMFIVEDINQFVGYNVKQDLTGKLVVLRHNFLDVVVHYQSIDNIPTIVWRNMSFLRIHKQEGNLEQKKKSVGCYKVIILAKYLIDHYINKGDSRAYIILAPQKNKLVAIYKNGQLQKISDNDFSIASQKYLSLNYKEIKEIKNYYKINSNENISDTQAKELWIEQNKQTYLTF
jgi:hypothetical protein